MQIGLALTLSLTLALAGCGSAPAGPGYYRVQRGDTLGKIARTNRQSVQDLARWNKLANPDQIEVGQLLRVAPPGSAAGAITAQTAPEHRAPPTAAQARPSAPAIGNVAPRTSIALVWPAQGEVIRRFDGSSSKGIDIAGTSGAPIVAAAAGTVVYAGNGLRGYGNLLIIKHNADFLTAYAHNRVLLVKEDQQVAQGQQVAQMGDTDNDRVMLHFELRYQGRSVDPAGYLPKR